MPGYKLSEARLQAAEFADDANNARWSTGQMDRHIKSALDACLIEFARARGDVFDQEASVTTDVSDGGVSLGALKHLHIRGVAIVVDPTTYEIPAKGGMRRGYADLVSRNLRILYVREYELPTDSSHPLIGVGGVPAPTFQAFDDWVCACAAARMLVKDAEQRGALDALRADLRAAVMKRGGTPSSWPMMRREWSPVVEQLNWQFVPSTKRLHTMRVAW